jgi:hypothetical protein
LENWLSWQLAGSAGDKSPLFIHPIRFKNSTKLTNQLLGIKAQNLAQNLPHEITKPSRTSSDSATAEDS